MITSLEACTGSVNFKFSTVYPDSYKKARPGRRLQGQSRLVLFEHPSDSPTRLTSPSVPIILVEDKTPDLDAFPGRGIVWRTGVGKRSMRHPPRPSIHLAVEALDQKHFIRGETSLVDPSVSRVVLDCVGLAAAVGIYQGNRNEVRVWH